MSTRGLGFIDTLSFDGTNYVAWKIRMLNYFRVIDPCMERIVDMGFSPPKDTQNLSLEDEKNPYLNVFALNMISKKMVTNQCASFENAAQDCL